VKHIILRIPQKLDNIDGDPDVPNQKMKEIPKWNISVTSYTSHI
jgi:hypothetical protein